MTHSRTAKVILFEAKKGLNYKALPKTEHAAAPGIDIGQQSPF